MMSTGLHVNKDMTLTTSHLELLRARGRVAREGAPKGEAHRVELRGVVETWLREKEEKREDQPYLLRPGKLNQLKAARQETLSSRGKGEALMATLTLLAAKGIATLQRTPSKGKKRGKWDRWIEDSTEWMVEAGWISERERGELVCLRAEGEETNQDNDEQTGVDPEGEELATGGARRGGALVC